ncbi:21271_t:CDS:2, partial [Racocetra persica]
IPVGRLSNGNAEDYTPIENSIRELEGNIVCSQSYYDQPRRIEPTCLNMRRVINLWMEETLKAFHGTEGANHELPEKTYSISVRNIFSSWQKYNSQRFVLLWKILSCRPLCQDGSIRNVFDDSETPADGTPVAYINLYQCCWQGEPDLRPRII